MRIGIIGAGASGLMAAIIAAKNGAHVTLIERKDKVGKKILATGNGKCNFTNKNIVSSDYNSQTQGIFENYISQFNEEQVILLFHQWGMMAKNREGYCYPRSEQAATVLSILEQQCKKENIKILTNTFPERIERKKQGFKVSLNDKSRMNFDKLILACGSFAGERNRDSFTGYTYAKHFGHSIVPVVPSLVQVRGKGKEFKLVAGVRCQAAISLFVDGKFVVCEEGELQLTDYGISGIPVFQLSRYVGYGAYYKKTMEAVIDFLPELEKKVWEEEVRKKWEIIDKSFSLEEFFLGYLNRKINYLFITSCGYIAEGKLKDLSLSDVLKIALQMKHWKISLTETNPYENGQVCAGGVSMEEIDITMESKIVKDLFFCGELLDVDGRCGGYNLQWAWTSGYLAGNNASL